VSAWRDTRSRESAICRIGRRWAEVRELPGCFASGHTVAELIESVEEAIALYLAGEGEESVPLAAEVAGFELSIETDRPLQAA
jgi:predicted RNase H-like HicB family nuclease